MRWSVAETAVSESSNEFLLKRVSSAARKLLVKERVRAMAGDVDAALQSLEVAVQLVVHDRPLDAVALGLLQAELLHLDLRHDDALAAMQKAVTPHLPLLSAAERFGVEQNLSDLQFYSAKAGASLFYNLVDQKRLLNFEWLDYHDLFAAKQDADRGRHYETLRILWQQHRRAYLHGCWLAQGWTNDLLAKECVHLKEWKDAVHHAILAPEDELSADIADGVLSARSAELVDDILKQLLTTANLRKHFVFACKLLKALADAIPDNWIPQVGEWLAKRAQEVRDRQLGVNHVSSAWEATAALAERYPSDLARSVIAIAVTHPIWTTKLDNPKAVIPERREVVRALSPLARAVPPNEIPQLAAATVPLLTDRRQVSDYHDVVNLLCNLAERGGTEVRDSLAASLYPSGQPVTRILAQVADVFGKEEIFDPVRLQGLAVQVAQEIRRHVQWLEPDQVAEPVAEQIFEYTSRKEDRTLKVFTTGLSGLRALAKHRAKLNESTLRDLIQATLDMAQNKDNFCANRHALLHCLVDLADAIPANQRPSVAAALEPLARGFVEESSEYPTAADADNPLNPFKQRVGRPEDVQGIALVALAALATGDAAATERIGKILEDTLCDHRPRIRRLSYFAARRLPEVPEGVVLGVLTGLRDPDPAAASTAFATLAKQTGWKLTRNHWRVFLMAVRLAQRTGSAKLRLNAAAALVARSSKCPDQLSNEQTELLTAFGNDICWSVRSIAKRQKEDGQ